MRRRRFGGMCATRWPSGIRNSRRRSASGADSRKFSYPTVISIDTEQLPSVDPARAAEFTTGELGKLLARAAEDEDDQQHDQQNQDQEWSDLPGCERRSPRRCELRGKESANEP
jgi:hypothetical protein